MAVSFGIKARPKTAAIAVAGVLGVAGIVAWIAQMTLGVPMASSSSNEMAWGLYLMAFMFFVGLGAGCMLVSAAIQVSGKSEYQGFTKLGALIGVCGVVVAMLFVVADLGHPVRVFELLVSGKIGSPLMWDIVVLPLFVVVGIVFLVMMHRDGGANGSSAKVAGVVSIVASFAALTVDAWIFALQPSIQSWSTALLPVWFVVSAIVCGLAVLLAVAPFVGVEAGARTKVARALGVALFVELYCLLVDLVTACVSGGVPLFGGVVASACVPWLAADVVLAIVACVLCFACSAERHGVMIAAAACALVAIFCKRFFFLTNGYAFPNITMSGPQIGLTGMTATGVGLYVPSALDWVVLVGIASLGVLAVLVAIRCLSSREN